MELSNLKNHNIYGEMINQMEKDVNDFMVKYSDDPRFLSGWGHAYFCDEDGGVLIYNIDKPHSHVCSVCGKEYRGFIYDSCFITMLRNQAVVTAIKSSIIYNTCKDKKYVDFTKKIVDFFSNNYDLFAIHAKEKITTEATVDVGGVGKIMPQGLNEAIISIRLINSLQLIKDELDKEYLEKVKNDLFEPIIKLLLPQKMHIHNIPCWINSAIGSIGLFFNEQKWIDEATVNPFNLVEQVENGVTKAGFWYEGSIHYNFFALEGIMSFLTFAKDYDYKLDETMKDSLKNMFKSAYYYAFDNDIFPNPSDGWPNINLKTYSYVYYMAYKVFGDEILPYIYQIEKNSLERAKLPLSEPYYYKNSIPIERLLYANDIDLELDYKKPEDRKSILFSDYNCALLRNENYNIFFKYGHQTTSHAHPDKMNIEVMANGKMITKDLSNSGYASKMCNRWHRKNLSHNSCMVNGKETDITRQGKLIDFSDNKVTAKTEAYDDIFYTRDISLDGKILNDVFTVECDEKSHILYSYHFDVLAKPLNVNMIDNDIFKDEYLMDVKEIILDNDLEISLDFAKFIVKYKPNYKYFMCKTYSNPANKLRDTLFIIADEKKCVFENKIVLL